MDGRATELKALWDQVDFLKYSFHAYPLLATQTPSAGGVWTKATLDGQHYDIGNAYDHVLAQFVVPVEGIYRFSMAAQRTSSAVNNYIQLALGFANSLTPYRACPFSNISNAAGQDLFCGPYSMQAYGAVGDTFQMLYKTDGGPLLSGVGLTYFQGELIEAVVEEH